MRLIAILLLIISAGAAKADSTPFEQANERFKARDFGAAAALYQKVIDSDGPDASTLYNLGNCEQKLGHHGRAILAYERARLLAPRDPDLLANLAFARKTAAVFEEPGRFPRMEAFLDFLSLNEWSFLVAGAALSLGVLAVIAGIGRLPGRPGAVMAGLAAFILLLGSLALYLRREERSQGVVVAQSATIRLSPFEKAEPVGTAGSGRIVSILKGEKGFRYVRVSGTGLEGWVSDKDVSPIMPQSATDGLTAH